MVNDEIGRLLGEIGQMLADDKEYRLDGTFLYAEAAAAMASSSIFKNLGNRYLFRWPTSELNMTLIDLWEAEEPAKRWTAMTYVIDDGTFDASFLFSEDLDPEEDSGARRERLVRARFGDKPIHYPPFP